MTTENKIKELENKIKELEEDARLDNDDYFHLEKDRDEWKKKADYLEKVIEKTIEYLGSKDFDRRRLINILDTELHDTENYDEVFGNNPLF